MWLGGGPCPQGAPCARVQVSGAQQAQALFLNNPEHSIGGEDSVPAGEPHRVGVLFYPKHNK